MERNSCKSYWKGIPANHIGKSHRDFVRFLYFKDLDDYCSAKINDPENIAVYRVGRVLFGLSSFPFLLSGTLIQHEHYYASLDPEFVLHFIKSLHVDDLISGADSLQEVERFYLTCKERLATTNFNLSKFSSNPGSLIYHINNVTNENIRLNFSDLEYKTRYVRA